MTAEHEVSVRDAILKAADYIEQNPHRFQYVESRVPECGTRSCAAGWIAAFMGKKEGEDAIDLCEEMLGIPYWDFDERMDDLTPSGGNWMNQAATCAATLRLYAEKYHPAGVKS